MLEFDNKDHNPLELKEQAQIKTPISLTLIGVLSDAWLGGKPPNTPSPTYFTPPKKLGRKKMLG